MCSVAAVPSPEDFRRASDILDFELPASYVEFCQLGGLSDIRLRHRVLSPEEILRCRFEVSGNLVPFADDGCGDLFCWRADTGVEPAVIFHEQETQRSSPAAPSFAAWLAANRL